MYVCWFGLVYACLDTCSVVTAIAYTMFGGVVTRPQGGKLVLNRDLDVKTSLTIKV